MQIVYRRKLLYLFICIGLLCVGCKKKTTEAKNINYNNYKVNVVLEFPELLDWNMSYPLFFNLELRYEPVDDSHRWVPGATCSQPYNDYMVENKQYFAGEIYFEDKDGSKVDITLVGTRRDGNIITLYVKTAVKTLLAAENESDLAKVVIRDIGSNVLQFPYEIEKGEHFFTIQKESDSK